MGRSNGLAEGRTVTGRTVKMDENTDRQGIRVNLMIIGDREILL